MAQSSPDFDFKFGDPLGCGSFGKVYKGTVKSGEYHGLECAIKEITRTQSAETEINILMSLSHENIVGYLGCKRHNTYYGLVPTVYIIMEYCNGGTLKDRLIKKRTDIDHLTWMLQMSSGLDYLHSNKIVHRDLKPSNVLVMIGIDGECMKISDFGLSKKMQEQLCPDGQKHSVALQTQVGTAVYAAPEVLKQGDQYDTKADVFSLGCICYGMLEDCFKIVGGDKHFSAFVYIPEQGDRVPLGTALKKYSSIQIGISTGISTLSNCLKNLTLGMLKEDSRQRMGATEVKCNLISLLYGVRNLNQPVHQDIGAA